MSRATRTHTNDYHRSLDRFWFSNCLEHDLLLHRCRLHYGRQQDQLAARGKGYGDKPAAVGRARCLSVWLVLMVDSTALRCYSICIVRQRGQQDVNRIKKRSRM